MRRDYGLYETKMLLTGKPTGLEAELLSLLTWVYSFNLNSIPSALFLRGCEGFSFKNQVVLTFSIDRIWWNLGRSVYALLAFELGLSQRGINPAVRDFQLQLLTMHYI